MLPFFTSPYPNELLYSAIARYHFYSGNLDCNDTLEELFGRRCVIPSVEIGSYLSVLAEKKSQDLITRWNRFSQSYDLSLLCFVLIESAAAGNFTGCITRWTGIIYKARHNSGKYLQKKRVYIIVLNVQKQIMHNTGNLTFIESTNFKGLIIARIMKYRCVNIQLQPIILNYSRQPTKSPAEKLGCFSAGFSQNPFC